MNETLTGEGQVKTYRGESIEALLPQIRTELGPEAVILRQREGLVGGVGGFFQKRCIEIEAQPGGPGVDVYDDGSSGPRVLSRGEGGAAGGGVLDPPPPGPPAGGAAAADDVESGAAPGPVLVRNDAATREGLSIPAVQALVNQAQPFAEVLSEMADDDAGIEAAAEPAPAVAERPSPRRAGALRQGLVEAGLGDDLAGEIVDAVVASVLPFANPGRLRTLVRDELALRVPVAPTAAPGRRTIAVVGPAGSGKTAAVAGIAAAHTAVGTDVACFSVDPSDGGGALEAMLAGTGVPVTALTAAELAAAATGAADLVLIDTAPAWAGAGSVKALAKALAATAPNEVHLALRAGTAAAAGAELAAGLAPLRPDRLLATAVAETTHLGGILDVAIRAPLALGYVAAGPASIAPADARDLASRITP